MEKIFILYHIYGSSLWTRFQISVCCQDHFWLWILKVRRIWIRVSILVVGFRFRYLKTYPKTILFFLFVMEKIMLFEWKENIYIYILSLFKFFGRKRILTVILGDFLSISLLFSFHILSSLHVSIQKTNFIFFSNFLVFSPIFFSYKLVK